MLNLHPQVTGRVQWLYEQLAPGTYVPKGQTLYRVDAKDYRVALQRAEAELRVANSNLQLELGNQRIARQELDVLRQSIRREPTTGGEGDPFDESLVLRQPQLEVARSRIDVAAANVAAARLNLSRTAYNAEFDAIVTESSAEIGQLVSPQTQLAQLAGTEQAWVRVSVPQDMLPFIEFPAQEQRKGAGVVVRQTSEGELVERHGYVLRLLSRLDESSRMAQILVVIEDPFALEPPPDAATKETRLRYAPLLINSYVEVEVEGREKRELVSVPRRAIREGNKVYGAAGDELEIRDLDVVWNAPEHVLVARAVKDGEQLIVSPLAGAVEGMKVRRVAETEPPSPLGQLKPEHERGE